ncbi:MAG: hypothetical protein K1000chlam2_01760 [Chlamydiae bacterium]|nr:hypothetical protein [Chlamydiota bacterium]
MKHGYREGRTIFEKPIGNPAQINEHGQKVLDKILNHPEKKVVQYTHKIHGPVIEIEAPEIGGVRFTGDGKEMMGFLEPKWFIHIMNEELVFPFIGNPCLSNLLHRSYS